MKAPKPEPQIPGYYCERHPSRILNSSKIVSVCANIVPIGYDLDLKTALECEKEYLIRDLEGNLRRCAGWSSKPMGAVRQSQWVRLPLSSAKYLVYNPLENLFEFPSFSMGSRLITAV